MDRYRLSDGIGKYRTYVKAIEIESGQEFALKKVNTENQATTSMARRESAILRNLQHPNIILLREDLQLDHKYYQVFEYAPRHIYRYLKTGREPFRGVIHRMVTPRGIRIATDGTIRLADFDFTRSITPPIRTLTPKFAKLRYLAPEVLLGTGTYGFPIDMWSVGVVFAEILIRRPLFLGDSGIDQLFKIFQLLGTPNEVIWPGCTSLPVWNPEFPTWYPLSFRDNLTGTVIRTNPQAVDLLERLVVLDPCDRLTASEALSHAFFSDLSGITPLP